MWKKIMVTLLLILSGCAGYFIAKAQDSQIQQGYLYDVNFDELEYIDEIRALNSMLAGSE